MACAWAWSSPGVPRGPWGAAMGRGGGLVGRNTPALCFRLFFRRHYPLNTVTFCDLDPQERK